ncbi:TonB-dependent receptor [Mangrovimonas spongiae]|uniref:TonB-dependent receptor n=1 Tax=Mangrovimonas spongiae TaxID=2494697 RepID=A0A3R9N5V7_9FLAO|nr:carboxypeptidase-like regulatory domain-containing protein [Mangrovimonas spongiae]RSK39708.1 TonB-dependent receptor [Mangrovimonas spongiae]
MPIKTNKKSVFYVLIFLFSCVTYAQIQDENKGKTPILQVFSLLEKQYDVQFNYAQDVISDIKTQKPPSNLSLKAALSFLETQTGLNYILMNKKFILVQAKQSILICGYLKDSNTKEPIENATVQSLDNNVVTDTSGYFKIEVKNQFSRVAIRHLGYGTVIRFVDQFALQECKTVFLNPNLQTLNEVVVSNFLVKGVNKVSDGSFDINFSDFDILPGLVDADVLQSIQAFPGIMSINETVSNINIRGGTNDQNLMLWDGIKMYQSGHFFGLISIYNPQITEQVSLTKNGTHAALTDGVSGTIAMKSNTEINPELKANFGLSLIDANAFGDIPLGKKSSIQVAARKSISDLIKTPTYNEFFDRISQDSEVEESGAISHSNKEFNFHDASLRWLYHLSEKDKLRVNFIYVRNELKFNENAQINNVLQSRESKLTQNSIAGAVNYSRQWSKSFSTNLNIYETDYQLKSTNANIIDSQRYLQKNNVSETSVKLTVNKKLSPKLNLTAGYHYVETEVTNLDDVDTPIYRLLISEVLRTYGGFSQIHYRLNNKTNIQFGLRYDYLEKFEKSIFEPRFNFNHRFLKHFSVQLLGELKHQSMSQVINFQNDFLGVEKRRWQLSNNQDVPVVQSQQVSLGLNYDRKGVLISAEGYYKEVDGITSQSQGFQNQYEFVKSNGHYKVYGVDVLTRKQFNNFNIWLSYSYMDNTYTFPSLEPSDFPSNYNITHATTLGTVYNYKDFSFSAGFNWHSGKPISTPIQNTPQESAVVFGDTNNTSLKDYLRVDVSGVYDFKLHRKARGKVGFSVWNLFNKSNELNRFYRVSNNQVSESTQQSLGITPNIFVRAYF